MCISTAISAKVYWMGRKAEQAAKYPFLAKWLPGFSTTACSTIYCTTSTTGGFLRRSREPSTRPHGSPASSLEGKTFMQQYWLNQHWYLVDTVCQFGFPTLFVTISPFEWSFPFPPWVENLRDSTGRGPTELPVQETTHIAHVLEQLIRGYVSGKNTNRWKSSLFADAQQPAIPNVQHYFYRFEFQKRGTLHVHLLLWIRPTSANYVPASRAVLQRRPSWYRTCNPRIRPCFRWTTGKHALKIRDTASTFVSDIPRQTTPRTSRPMPPLYWVLFIVGSIYSPRTAKACC